MPVFWSAVGEIIGRKPVYLIAQTVRRLAPWSRPAAGSLLTPRPFPRLRVRASDLHRRHDRLLEGQLDGAFDRLPHHPGVWVVCGPVARRWDARRCALPPAARETAPRPSADRACSLLRPDMYEVKERGQKMGYYYGVPLIGPAIGPLCAFAFNFGSSFFELASAATLADRSFTHPSAGPSRRSPDAGVELAQHLLLHRRPRWSARGRSRPVCICRCPARADDLRVLPHSP